MDQGIVQESRGPFFDIDPQKCISWKRIPDRPQKRTSWYGNNGIFDIPSALLLVTPGSSHKPPSL